LFESEQAWRAISRAYMRLAPTIDKRLKALIGLTYSEYEALSQLNSATQQMTMADLASRVSVTRTHASRLIDSLEAAGLARRESNPDDGRSFLVQITKDGMLQLQKHASTVQSVFADLPESLAAVVAAQDLEELVACIRLAATRNS